MVWIIVTLLVVLIPSIWFGLKHPTTHPHIIKSVDVVLSIFIAISTLVTEFVENYISTPLPLKRTIRIKHAEQTTSTTSTTSSSVMDSEIEHYEYLKKEELSMRMVPSKHPSIALPPIKNKIDLEIILSQKLKQWKQREESLGKLSSILVKHYEKPLQLIRTFSNTSTQNVNTVLELEEVEETQEMIGKQKPVMESVKQLIDTCKQDSQFHLQCKSMHLNSILKDYHTYLSKYFVPYLQLYQKCIPLFHDCVLQINRRHSQIKLMDGYKKLMSLLDQYCGELDLNSILFYPIQNMFICVNELQEWNYYSPNKEIVQLMNEIEKWYDVMKDCVQINKLYQVKKHVNFLHVNESPFVKESQLTKIKFNKHVQQSLLSSHLSKKEMETNLHQLVVYSEYKVYLLENCLCLVSTSDAEKKKKKKVISFFESTQVKPFQMKDVKYGFVIQTLNKQYFFKVENLLEQRLWIQLIQQYCLSKFDLNFDLIIQPKPQINLDDPQAYYPMPLKQLFAPKSEYLKYQHELPETTEYIEYLPNDDIACATVEKLIEKLTNTVGTSIDRATPFQISFLMTYRSFISPKQLLHELQLRYFMPPPKLEMTSEEFKVFKFAKLFPIRLAVIQILKYWISKQGHDFISKNSDTEALLTEWNQFVSNIGKSSERFMQNVTTQLQETLEKVIKEESMLLERKNSMRMSFKYYNSTLWQKLFSSKKKNLQLLDYPFKELAKQLTQMESNYFVAILPRECLNQNWNKNKDSASNITALIQRTNVTVHLLTWSILQYSELQERVNALSKVIKLAKELQCLNNFHGCFEVIGALNSIAIHRLKQTWSLVSKELVDDFKQLEQFVSPMKNFKTMRQAVKSNVPPLLPYLGIFLTDFTFIDESNEDVLNGKINFYKNFKLSTVIQELQALQKVQYEFTVIPEIEELLYKKETFTEDELIAMSMKLEKKQ